MAYPRYIRIPPGDRDRFREGNQSMKPHRGRRTVLTTCDDVEIGGGARPQGCPSQPSQQRPQRCVTVIRKHEGPAPVPHDKAALDQRRDSLARDGGTLPVGAAADADSGRT